MTKTPVIQWRFVSKEYISMDMFSGVSRHISEPSNA
jgi:hypothetical protein